MKGHKGQYQTKTIGTADDTMDANGVEVLSFTQAQEQAKELATEVLATSSGRSYGPFTVKAALDHYLTEKLGHEGRDTAENRRRLAAIAGELGEIEVSKLTKQDVSKWMREIAEHRPGFVVANSQTWI